MLVVDVKQDPQGRDLYVLANQGREVWTVEATGRNPRLAFTLDDLSGNQGAPCQATASALAVRRNRGSALDPPRVYLAQRTPVPAVVVVEKGLTSWTEKSRVTLDGFPYAAVAGLAPNPGLGGPLERLAVATTFGLRVFDPEALAQPVFSDSVGASYVASQALSVNESYRANETPAKADRFLLVDQGGDWLRSYLAGQEQAVQSRFPVGSLAPVLSRGDATGVLFLGDPLSNSIRVIDRESGVQRSQFGVRGNREFGLSAMVTVPLADTDLLVTPVVNLNTDGRAPYRGVVARLIGKESPPPDCRDSLAQTPPPRLDLDDYDSLGYLARPSPLLFFVRRPRPDLGIPGRVWALPVDLLGRTADEILPGGTPQPDAEVPLTVRKLAVDPEGGLLAAVSLEIGVAAELEVQELGAEGSLVHFALEEVVAEQVDTVAVLRPRQDAGTVALVLLSVPITGQVVAVAFDEVGQADWAVIPTGGAPMAMALSPDLRRAYVVHPSIGQVSAIDLDCQPLPACLGVDSNIRLADAPFAVQFSPDGGEALVMHLYNGRISVIE
jgi:hypothetical protein